MLYTLPCAIVLLAGLSTAHSLQTRPALLTHQFKEVSAHSVHRSRLALMSTEDPTDNPFTQAINKFQQALQESPVAKLKKGLSKLQAGDYDEEAMEAELKSLIASNPAIMFSFTT